VQGVCDEGRGVLESAAEPFLTGRRNDQFSREVQQLLRELFQFDAADLDFGIYRIMNYKRAEVERFITENLPRDVAAALEQGALAMEAQAAQELAEAKSKVLDELGAEALDADENLVDEELARKPEQAESI